MEGVGKAEDLRNLTWPMPRDVNFYLFIHLFLFFVYFVYIFFLYISTAAKILLREFEANVDASGDEFLTVKRLKKVCTVSKEFNSEDQSELQLRFMIANLQR